MKQLRLSLIAALAALPLIFGGLAAKAADIVDTAVEAGQFKTLVAAVEAAELVETLKGDGPFTVFAPTDDAFAKLQQRISGLESAIADRREVYNEAVNNNNVRIEQFPDVIVARLFNFQAFGLLSFREEELADVDIKALFS